MFDRHILKFVALTIIALATIRLEAAAPEAELRDRVSAAAQQDNATGAAALLAALNECAGRAANAAKNAVTRRAFELVMCDAQDAIAKFASPEAMKVFAGSINRLPTDAAVTLLFALKSAPANADVDTAAQKMLGSGMDFRVRTALTELLGAHKHVPSIDKIVLGLNPLENPSIQIATCRALAQIPDKKAVPLLVKYLNALPGKGGRYKFEATAALRALTGENIDANPALWKAWWDKHAKDFVFDAAKMAAADFNFEMSEKQEMEYYEVPVVENRLVIVLDCSGSMSMGGKPNRIESAKKELTGFINSLNDKQMFNLVCFSSTVRRWKKENGLLFATDANKKDAIKFIESQHEGGGTQTTLAMEEVLREISVMHGCETVYIVTDGNPNPWAQGVTEEEQERLLHWINQPLKIRINTIGIYSITKQDQDMLASLKATENPKKMKKYLIDIAANNDGVYREVDKDGVKAVKLDPKKEKELKEKAEKEKAAKDAAAKAPPIDPKKPAEPEPKKEAPATPAVEVPRSEKDISVPFLIEPPKKDNTPAKPAEKPEAKEEAPAKTEAPKEEEKKPEAKPKKKSNEDE